MPRGRPRALDEAKQREVCALLSSAGCGLPEAAQYVGCAPNTIRREAQRNEEFDDKLRRAQMFAKLSPLQAMQRAASTPWRAAAWQRTDPEQFGQRSPAAFRPKQAKAFVKDVLNVVDSEVLDPLKRWRIDDRLQALAKYPIHEVRDTARTGASLQEAMKYLDKVKSGENIFDQLGVESPLAKMGADRKASPASVPHQSANRSAKRADPGDFRVPPDLVTHVMSELSEVIKGIRESAAKNDGCPGNTAPGTADPARPPSASSPEPRLVKTGPEAQLT